MRRGQRAATGRPQACQVLAINLLIVREKKVLPDSVNEVIFLQKKTVDFLHVSLEETLKAF